MNLSAVEELALGATVLLITVGGSAGWAAGRSGGPGVRLRPGHSSSSSDVSGVVGTSLLEQADMLVSGGVGKRVPARGRKLRSLIARAGGLGWRRHGAALRGTERVESCSAKEIRVEFKFVSAIATAEARGHQSCVISLR